MTKIDEKCDYFFYLFENVKKKTKQNLIKMKPKILFWTSIAHVISVYCGMDQNSIFLCVLFETNKYDENGMKIII